MPKNIRTVSLIVILILVVGSIFLFFKYFKGSSGSKTRGERPTFASDPNAPCPGAPFEGTMTETLMDGLIKKGQTYKALPNWYSCHAPEAGDLVLYRYSTQADPVVRVIRAVPGDSFKVIRDDKAGAWNLEVNGDLVMDQATGEPYYFGSKAPSTLSLYEKANNGVLKDGDVIVMANVPPGGFDSGLFGVANVQDMVARVEPVSP